MREAMGVRQPELPPAAETLISRFRSRQARLGVVGLGYVGLPLAVVLAESGFTVTGVDLDAAKVEALNRGESYIEDIPAASVAALVAAGRLRASTDFAVLKDADGVSICVPTPLRKTGDPDLSFIVSAAQALRPALHAGMVVILESTTYPGTTRELVQPELETTGLHVGRDLFLAFSPERVDPGRSDWTTKNTPKVIGGITPACTAAAAAMYEAAMDTVVRVSSTEVAEMTKLLENTFRAVNIAMVNEMALMCDRLGLDVWEVIDAASTKPFGFMRFLPGPGLGGHCIPIDPLYLSWKMKSVKYNARIIDLASEINTNMPRYVVEKTQDILNQQGKALRGARLLIVGVAYKPDISDTRESPGLDIIGLLRAKGAQVAYYDPFVPAIEHEDWGLTSVPDLMAEARRADCVVIVTHHSGIDYRALVEASPLVFDTRNAAGGAGVRDPKVVRL
jgi:UDP-N-acetyl-D-glucosamine dehydrogenase